MFSNDIHLTLKHQPTNTQYNTPKKLDQIMAHRDEPRYGLERQQNSTRLLDCYNRSDRPTNTTVRNGDNHNQLAGDSDGVSLQQSEIVAHDDRRDDVDYVMSNINPPRGFELDTTNGMSSKKQSSSSSASSTLNRPSSSGGSSDAFHPDVRPILNSNHNMTNLLDDNSTNHLSDRSMLQNGHSQQSTSENLTRTIRTIQNDDSVNDQSARPSTSQTNVDHQNNNKPSTSTSSQSMFFSFNSFVSRLSKALAQTSMTVLQNAEWCLQQEDVPRFAFAHKKSLEETWKLMDKVVKLCQRPQMNLNNSPPFILEILPETYQLLKLIHTKYDSSDKYPADDNDYSLIFLENLQDRCRQTLKLFKVAKDEMFDENSEHRHKLTRNTLVFNHILSELKAIFPYGYFISDKYLITKKGSAGEFWKQNFGHSVLVDWKVFYHALQRVHNIDSSFFSLNALKQTIDLTCDDYISIFEFDVFTRLFQPWSTLLKNWQILAVTHPGYKAFLTYDELKARLQKHINKPGSYVFRLSCTRLGQWAIGYVTDKGEILQTIVQNISLSQTLTESKVYLYPDGKETDHNLSILCSGLAGDDRNVTVTEEQYEIYCGVGSNGSSVLTCKICFDNDKNIRLEPCNHLLCTSCLASWQDQGKQGCPYCRTEIKETVQIVMDLPNRGQRS